MRGERKDDRKEERKEKEKKGSLMWAAAGENLGFEMSTMRTLGIEPGQSQLLLPLEKKMLLLFTTTSHQEDSIHQ